MRTSKYPKKAVTIGQKIRKARMDRKKDKDLLDVANKVGITESYLSRIEADKNLPSMDVAAKLVEELGIKKDDIIPELMQIKIATLSKSTVHINAKHITFKKPRV